MFYSKEFVGRGRGASAGVAFATIQSEATDAYADSPQVLGLAPPPARGRRALHHERLHAEVVRGPRALATHRAGTALEQGAPRPT